MTTRGHRRTVPALIGLATGALVAVIVVVVTLIGRPAPPAGAPESVDASLAGGAADDLPEVDAGPPPPDARASSPLLLPLIPPPSAPPAPALATPGVLPIPSPPTPPTPALPAPPRPKPPAVPRPAPPKPALSGPAGQVVALTNAERARAGCKPLNVDQRLVVSALRHSQDMARREYFSPASPEGTDFADREAAAGFHGRGGGENIARGQRTAAEVMADWMSSPGHRRNILDCSFTSIGVGYVADGRYWTQNFGR